MSGSISFIYEYGEIDPAEHWCYTKGLENFCVWGQDKLGVREIDLRVRFMKGQASLNTAVEGKPAKSQLRLIREGSNHNTSYEVSIDLTYSKGYHDDISCLAHEMVHAEQFALGNLSYTPIRTEMGLIWGFQWLGRAFRPPATMDQYKAAPWELDANTRGEVLTKMYFDQLMECCSCGEGI